MNITRINSFESADGKEDECLEFLESLLPYILSSRGCMSCEVLQHQKKENQFVVIEKWQSKEDHENSLKSFPKAEMEAAMPLFGGPPQGDYYI